MIDTPLLPLDFWRHEIGYSPWHFWGLADNDIVPVTSKCNDIVKEYGWQSADEAGRSDIRSAIVIAEQVLLQNMGFNPAPAYSEETTAWPQYFNPRAFNPSRASQNGKWLSVQLSEGYVQAVGVEQLTLVEADAALVFTDEDGDTLEDTFTVTVATTVTDPQEIAMYFTFADRLDEDSEISARWRVEPVHVTITGGNAVIKGKKWLVVKPALYESKANYPLNPTIAGNFITTCDIYRRFTYKDGTVSTTDSQAAIIWESRPCSCCTSSIPNSSDPASEGWLAARAGVRDGYNGIVTPAEATYDILTNTWSAGCNCIDACGSPDKVLVRYLAGLNLDTHGWMQKSMRMIVARLASAEMTKRICACNEANRELGNWQFDVSRIEGPETYQTSPENLNNPLGTRRGHIYAWQQIRNLARMSGVIV